MKKREQLSERSLHHSSSDKPVQAKLSGKGSGNRFDLSQLGSAQSMPAPVQAKMEESMGADFSGVRLYESPMISDNGAQAVASGNNVAFAPGMLDFSSKKGLGLLGHELSHVASQARGEVSGSGFVNNAALEHKADEDGERAASAFDSQSGQTLSPMSAAGGSFSSAAPMQAKKGGSSGSANPLAKMSPTKAAKNLIDYHALRAGSEMAENWNYTYKNNKVDASRRGVDWTERDYMDRYAKALGSEDGSNELGLTPERKEAINTAITLERGKIMNRAIRKYQKDGKEGGIDPSAAFAGSKEMMLLEGVRHLRKAIKPFQYTSPYDDNQDINDRQADEDPNYARYMRDPIFGNKNRDALSPLAQSKIDNHSYAWNVLQQKFHDYSMRPQSKEEMIKRLKNSRQWNPNM